MSGIYLGSGRSAPISLSVTRLASLALRIGRDMENLDDLLESLAFAAGNFTGMLNPAVDPNSPMLTIAQSLVTLMNAVHAEYQELERISTNVGIALRTTE